MSPNAWLALVITGQALAVVAILTVWTLGTLALERRQARRREEDTRHDA